LAAVVEEVFVATGIFQGISKNTVSRKIIVWHQANRMEIGNDMDTAPPRCSFPSHP
jgi:hypothetical protein